MSLYTGSPQMRDVFAVEAMKAIMSLAPRSVYFPEYEDYVDSSLPPYDSDEVAEDIALDAYEIADAMMVARQVNDAY